MIFLLNRFGVPYATFMATDPGDPDLHRALLGRPAYIEIQSPG